MTQLADLALHDAETLATGIERRLDTLAQAVASRAWVVRSGFWAFAPEKRTTRRMAKQPPRAAASPVLKLLFGDWQTRRRGRALPAPADFEPLETGRTLDDCPDPEYRAFMRQGYTAAGRHPLNSIQTQLTVDGRLRRYEALLLPLAADGGNVDMLMIGIAKL